MKNALVGHRPVRRVRRSREEIASLLKGYRSSGLSQSDYARSAGIILSTLCGWLKRELIQGNAPEESLPRLVPVKITGDHDHSPTSSRSCIGLTLPGGFHLTIPPDFDDGALLRLLTLLAGQC